MTPRIDRSQSAATWIAAFALATSIAGAWRGGASAQQTSASIAGIVLTDEARAQPVRRAIVTLSGGSLTRSRSVITDDAGRFTFDHLASGRFTLTASKPTFVTSAYGAK